MPQAANVPPKVKVKGLPEISPMRKGVPDDIPRVIAVHSGKGGVGKTFVAVNLALFLADHGRKVGILDADIDCPNVFKMLGISGKLVVSAAKKITPLLVPQLSSGGIPLKVVSMAALQEREDQVWLWRGPIVSRAVEQLMHDTAWGELDVLIVDLPPGTSDVPISVLKMVASSASHSANGSGDAAVVVVSTPQELSLLDAKKSLRLAQEMKVKVAGLVENMAGKVFGTGRVQQLAKEAGVPFLGSIPLKREYAAPDAGNTPAFRTKELQKIFAGLLD